MSVATEPTKAEIDAFVAPKVLVGQPVVYYPMANVNSRKPSMGTAIWTGQNNRIINILEVDHYGRTLVREAVRHVSDPKLKLNDDQREFGAWDYTPFYKHECEIRDDIEERIASLEQAVINPDLKSDRQVLLLTAKKLGMRGYSTMRSADLRQAIVKHKAELAESGAVVEEETAE